MKKLICVFTILASLLLLAGCGNDSKGGELGTGKVTCTKEMNSSSSIKKSEKAIITYKDNKVLKVLTTNTVESDAETISFQAIHVKKNADLYNQVEGMTFEYEKVKDTVLEMSLEIDFEKLNREQLDTLGDSSEMGLFNNEDVSLDDYLDNNFRGYTCDNK